MFIVREDLNLPSIRLGKDRYTNFLAYDTEAGVTKALDYLRRFNG